jgi:intracellular multiplication protein IcmE
MLSFNLMTLPNLPESFPVNAYAVDPDTARVALSSDTNNHYIIRYGSLFAASFLEGLGQAVLQSGQMVTSTAASTIVTSPKLNTGQQIKAALGNVGNKFGDVLQAFYNIPPTVQVYQGTGVGILFTEDVAQPKLSG